MLRNLSSKIHKEYFRLTTCSRRWLSLESESKNGNSCSMHTHNENLKTIKLHSNSNEFSFKILIDKWKEKFHSNSKNKNSLFKEDFLMWCTGMLCLSSFIVGHKWAHIKNNKDATCPIHYITKDILNDIILNSVPSKRLLFAVNPDNVPAIVQSQDHNDFLLEDESNIDDLDDLTQKFKSVADECNGSLLNCLAVKLAEANENEKAFQMFKEASDLGNTTAAYNIAISYEHGIGIKQSYSKAAEYYEKAGNKNHIKSLYNLASLYYGGLLGDSIENGFLYFKKAADLGLAQAQLFVGLRYTEEKNWTEAFKYFEMAAEQNDTSSMFNLAICYENGYGTHRDIVKAVEFYRKGAVRGHMLSQFSLADVYQHGSKGVHRNLKEALKWFQLAKQNGHTEAESRIEHIQYEIQQQNEDQLLTMFESNSLLQSLQPIKQVLENVPSFHKSSSMPNLQNCQISNNNDNNYPKSFHKSMLLLNEQFLALTDTKARPGLYGVARDLSKVL